MWKFIKNAIKIIFAGYIVLIAIMLGMLVMTSFMLSALPATP